MVRATKTATDKTERKFLFISVSVLQIQFHIPSLCHHLHPNNWPLPQTARALFFSVRVTVPSSATTECLGQSPPPPLSQQTIANFVPLVHATPITGTTMNAPFNHLVNGDDAAIDPIICPKRSTRGCLRPSNHHHRRGRPFLDIQPLRKIFRIIPINASFSPSSSSPADKSMRSNNALKRAIELRDRTG